MAYALTFLEGIATFLSPCLLPLLPVYLSYFGGGDAGEKTSMRRTAVCVIGFIIGFTIPFTLLGAFAGALGSLVLEHQRMLDAACGIIVIIFGLNYLGVLRIPALQRTLKPKTSVIPRTFASSIVFGAVFSIGWTPCVGAFLGSALSLAASSAQAGTGVALLLCYSLGLGVPFALSAFVIDRIKGAFDLVKRHYSLVNTICGTLLVVVGVLMATGLFSYWLRILAA